MTMHPYEHSVDDAAAPARAPAPVPVSARSTARTFDAELKILPGIRLPLRSMLIEAPEARILISPVGTDAERAAVGNSLDAVVAPSLLHGLHTKDAQALHRPGGVWGPPGFAAKHPDIAAVHTLTIDPWPFGDVLDFEVVAGAPKREEVVFFHRASRTIYTADVVFNLGEPSGLLAPIAYRIMGVYKHLAMMKMWRGWIKDAPAFRRSMERILTWDFDRIVVAHGAIVETGGRAKLEAALRERGVL